MPLIEIVSEPDISSPDEAWEYLTRLKEIILYTAVSDCNMEEGSLRCDANISIRPVGQKEFGTKTEIKNVNSFRFIRQALEYEITRHEQVLNSGGNITQETRFTTRAKAGPTACAPKNKRTIIAISPSQTCFRWWLTKLGANRSLPQLPELPEAKRKRLVEHYGITEADAATLTRTQSMADQFEEAASAAKNPKRVANLVQAELLGRLKAKNLEIEQSPISMKGIAFSADLVESGAISGKHLKELYDLAFERNEDFPAIYEKEKPQQITDTGAIEKLIDEVIAANPKQLEQYRAGKKTVAGFFVGQIMKASKGQANPALVNELLTKKLDG